MWYALFFCVMLCAPRFKSNQPFEVADALATNYFLAHLTIVTILPYNPRVRTFYTRFSNTF